MTTGLRAQRHHAQIEGLETMAMNRRGFLASSGLAIVGATTFGTTPARAEAVAAALAIAAAVAGIIAAFTKSGDGGLSAYLESIRGLQIETINQLATIQLRINELNAAVAELPERVKGILHDHELEVVQAQLVGAIEELRLIVVTRSLTRQLNATEVQAAREAVTALRNRVVEARQNLLGWPDIRSGPHAALLMAFTFPVEITARYFQGEPPETLFEAIQGYKNWAATMMDENTISGIPTFNKSWLQKAEAALGVVENLDPPSKRMATTDGHQLYCFEYREFIPGVPAKTHESPVGRISESITTETVIDAPAIPEKIGSISRIAASVGRRESDKGGARFVELDIVKTTDFEAAQSSGSCPSKDGPFKTHVERVKDIKSDLTFDYQRFLLSHAQANKAVAALNEARLKYAFGTSALQVAQQMTEEFGRWEELYGRTRA